MKMVKKQLIPLEKEGSQGMEEGRLRWPPWYAPQKPQGEQRRLYDTRGKVGRIRGLDRAKGSAGGQVGAFSSGDMLTISQAFSSRLPTGR
jgi:hypothetical protein